MDLIEFHSFSNAWFWFCMVFLWGIATQMFVGLPYHHFKLASRQNPERQSVLVTAAHLNAQRVMWGYRPFPKVLIVGFGSFIITFWGVIAFSYSIELLQAAFFLIVPILPTLYLRWRLVLWIVKALPEFDELYKKIRSIRFWTFVSSCLTIFIATFWGVLFLKSGLAL
jgi:hypothetical protein